MLKLIRTDSIMFNPPPKNLYHSAISPVGEIVMSHIKRKNIFDALLAELEIFFQSYKMKQISIKKAKILCKK